MLRCERKAFNIFIRRPSLICSLFSGSQVYDGVMKNVNEQSPLKQKVFRYALSVSRERNANLEFGRPVSAWLAFKHKLVDKAVFSKIRDKFGGNLRY